MSMTFAVRKSKRHFVFAVTAAAALAGFVAGPAVAQPQAYPDRTVRIVLPLPPGTVNDTVLRLLADPLSKRWGQPVIVDNKPGASTIIGTDAVVRAPADGYTLLANVSLVAQNQALRKKLPYDASQDLIPVVQLNRQQLLLLVRADFPVHSIAELVAYAKANPGNVNFGSWGLGSTAHLVEEKFRVDKGIQMTHVPYKGAGEINLAMLGGQIDVGVTDQLSPNEFIKSGKLRVIGVTGPARLPSLPDVQTLGEAGVKGFDGYSWFGLFAPAGTPPQVVRKIADSVKQIQSDPSFEKKMQEVFVTPSSLPPDEFRKAFLSEIDNWANVVNATGVKLD